MTRVARHFFAATAIALSLATVTAARADSDDRTVYLQTNLVSNTMAEVQPADPDLQNSWGVANIPGGPLWISDNNDGLSTLYDGNGVKQGLTVTIPLPPGRMAPPAAAPTGMVWNPTSSFTITANSVTVPAIFIWVSEDGTITAWNPAADPIVAGASTASLVLDNSKSGAVYKGLGFGTNVHGTFLFATNIFAGTVEVYDKNFKLATLDGTAIA